MKFVLKNILVIIFFFFTPLLHAQDIEVIAPETFLYQDTLGIEMVFDFEIINISAQPQTVFEVRTLDSLPPNWTSSLCFGDICFASFIDSIAAEPPLFNPLQPGDTLASSLHVISDSFAIGTAYVQIQIGTFHNPSERITINFVVTTDPSVNVEKTEEQLDGYSLSPNYPNPFNPSTKITYKVGEPGLVQLKVYNILGVEVAELANEYKSAGNYSADFNALGLSSGVYFYTLSVNNFTQTRKMILEK